MFKSTAAPPPPPPSRPPAHLLLLLFLFSSSFSSSSFHPPPPPLLLLFFFLLLFSFISCIAPGDSDEKKRRSRFGSQKVPRATRGVYPFSFLLCLFFLFPSFSSVLSLSSFRRNLAAVVLDTPEFAMMSIMAFRCWARAPINKNRVSAFQIWCPLFARMTSHDGGPDRRSCRVFAARHPLHMVQIAAGFPPAPLAALGTLKYCGPGVFNNCVMATDHTRHAVLPALNTASTPPWRVDKRLFRPNSVGLVCLGPTPCAGSLESAPDAAKIAGVCFLTAPQRQAPKRAFSTIFRRLGHAGPVSVRPHHAQLIFSHHPDWSTGLLLPPWLAAAFVDSGVFLKLG